MGVVKAIGTYIWYIYTDQIVTKYLLKLSVELCARTKNKTWFLLSKLPQSNERDSCENG